MKFLREVIAEMKQVIWPNKTAVWESTKVVIGSTLVLVVFIFGSDQLLNWLVGLFL
ncbi:MAG: preprotein translocase subunit SecE [Candidatus Delongbacteria bacterium]|nr:preprotein translocase subunit SecE [Candidatus Delongbacteria bacterium]MBN2835390.1 preprotein translocase subunit SecE [Candidatus Delongbacteria bacterium]